MKLLIRQSKTLSSGIVKNKFFKFQFFTQLSEVSQNF